MLIAGTQQLAAEKKLLKAQGASLRRRAAEELAILRAVQKEHVQVKLGLIACIRSQASAYIGGLALLCGHLLEMYLEARIIQPF